MFDEESINRSFTSAFAGTMVWTNEKRAANLIIS